MQANFSFASTTVNIGQYRAGSEALFIRSYEALISNFGLLYMKKRVHRFCCLEPPFCLDYCVQSYHHRIRFQKYLCWSDRQEALDFSSLNRSGLSPHCIIFDQMRNWTTAGTRDYQIDYCVSFAIDCNSLRRSFLVAAVSKAIRCNLHTYCFIRLMVALLFPASWAALKLDCHPNQNSTDSHPLKCIMVVNYLVDGGL